MSISKDKWCDCCGKKIPWKENQVHMEYDGHVAHSMPYIAGDCGNLDAGSHSPSDKVFGLVDIVMYRDNQVHTVVPNNYFLDQTRCKDICPECKIKFLESAIKYLKTYEY